MVATSTFKQLLEEVSEQTGVGYVLPTVTGTTAQFTLANAYGSGPWANRFPRGSPILTTAGTAINEVTYVDNHTPSSGVTTITPAPSNTWTDGILFKLGSGIDHPDRVKEAVNRALTEWCSRWQKIPLTYVPDGDMLAATIADFWTASAGTASYASPAVPEVAGQRVIQISHSSSATLTSNTIPARTGEVWYFDTSIRPTTDGDTAALTILDVTNTATITPSYEDGDGDTTSRAFVSQRGQFTVPATCDRIAFRLTVSGSGTMTAQMSQIVAFPQDARSFPFQQRVRSIDHVGNFFRLVPGSSNSGPDERRFSDPFTVGGRQHTFSNDGDHLVVHFNSTVGALYYDELIYGSALAAMTDTTTFPLPYVTRWAKYELYKYLAEHDPTAFDPAKRPVRSPYISKANAAKRGAEQSFYEPEPVTVVGRR